VAEGDHLFQETVEVQELKTLTVALVIPFIVFLYAFIQDVVKSFYVLDRLHPPPHAASRQVGVAQGPGSLLHACLLQLETETALLAVPPQRFFQGETPKPFDFFGGRVGVFDPELCEPSHDAVHESKGLLGLTGHLLRHFQADLVGRRGYLAEGLIWNFPFGVGVLFKQRAENATEGLAGESHLQPESGLAEQIRR
jgi:hypothetical protein